VVVFRDPLVGFEREVRGSGLGTLEGDGGSGRVARGGEVESLHARNDGAKGYGLCAEYVRDG
jgi:hypothetical protein